MDDDRLARWVFENCRFAQQDAAVAAAEQKHIQSVEALQVIAEDEQSETERTYGDSPTAMEPGTVRGPLVRSSQQKVLVRGRVFWTAALQQYWGMGLEESLRTSMNEGPPNDLAKLVDSGDQIEIKNMQIVPAEPDMFDVTIHIEVSGEHEIDEDDINADIEYDRHRDDMAAEDFQGP